MLLVYMKVGVFRLGNRWLRLIGGDQGAGWGLEAALSAKFVMGEAPSRCKAVRSQAKTTRPRCPTTSYTLDLLHLTTYRRTPLTKLVDDPLSFCSGARDGPELDEE
jgi:hypothetical protein